MTDAAEQFVSRTDYLTFERDVPIRHEWVGGLLYAMTGTSGRHNRLALRLVHSMTPSADLHGCRVYASDMKVVAGNFGYYPDVMVVCDPELPGEYHEERPCLIAEVRSPSTGDRDRREKWAAYKTLESLRHYVMIRQDDTQIEHWFRNGEGPWQHEIIGPDDDLRLTCPPITIPVADLYRNL